MRILVVHNLPVQDPRSGGGQRVSHEIAAQALRMGHDVLVLLLGRDAPAIDALPYETRLVPEHRRLLVNAWRVSRAVRRLAMTWHPDVVYASAAEGGMIAGALPAGVGLLATFHHPDPPPVPELAGGLGLVRALGEARRGQAALLEAALLRGAHHVTVPSAWSRRMVHERGYLPPGHPVQVVGNGVPASWVDVSGTRVPPDADLCFVGRLERQKGVDVLLRALATDALGHVTVRLVGAGPEENAYRHLAQELGIADRVAFLGHQPADHVRDWIRRSRAFVLPSRHESFGMALLEAMATGTPCVATAVGGVPEFARDGQNAFLVPPEDSGALAAALRRVLDEPATASALGTAGRETARARTWPEMTTRMLHHMHLAHELSRPVPGAARRRLGPLYRRLQAMRSTRAAPAAERRPPPSAPLRIAVVRFGLIGDQLLLDPLLAALEERYPDASTLVMVDDARRVPPWLRTAHGRTYRELRVRTADGRGWVRPGDAGLQHNLAEIATEWGTAPPDLLLFTNPMDDAVVRELAARLSGLAPDAWRAGFVDGQRPPFLHAAVAWTAGDHEIERLLALGGTAGADTRFRLPRVEIAAPPLPTHDGPTVAIHVGASHPVRRWPPPRVRSLAIALRDRADARIVLVGGPDERPLVQEIGLPGGEEAGAARFIDLVGKTAPSTLAGVLAAADLVVANDSFPMHLAVAVGTPTVGLIGPGALRYWGYPSRMLEVVRTPVVCSPRSGEQCPFTHTCPHGACMQAIEADEVLARCLALL